MNDVQPDPETSREMQAEQVRHLMALLAPGTPIREGLDRIVTDARVVSSCSVIGQSSTGVVPGESP